MTDLRCIPICCALQVADGPASQVHISCRHGHMSPICLAAGHAAASCRRLQTTATDCSQSDTIEGTSKSVPRETWLVDGVVVNFCPSFPSPVHSLFSSFPPSLRPTRRYRLPTTFSRYFALPHQYTNDLVSSFGTFAPSDRYLTVCLSLHLRLDTIQPSFCIFMLSPILILRLLAHFVRYFYPPTYLSPADLNLISFFCPQHRVRLSLFFLLPTTRSWPFRSLHQRWLPNFSMRSASLFQLFFSRQPRDFVSRSIGSAAN
jgi:hypothetical protein